MSFDFQEMKERLREGRAFWNSISPRQRQPFSAERSRAAARHAAKISPLVYFPNGALLRAHVHEWVLSDPVASLDLLLSAPFCETRLSLISGTRAIVKNLVVEHLLQLGAFRIRALDLASHALPQGSVRWNSPTIACDIGRPILQFVDPLIEALADVLSEPDIVPDVLLAAEAFEQ